MEIMKIGRRLIQTMVVVILYRTLGGPIGLTIGTKSIVVVDYQTVTKMPIANQGNHHDPTSSSSNSLIVISHR